jgi:spore germination protein YaaH
VTNAVAPEGWITVVDTYVRSQVTDESKLVMGMNSYGYTANESSPYAITIQTKAQTDAAIDLSLGTRDTGSNEMFYETAGNQHYVWCDETTLNAKRAFIEGLGYDRICVWHLGGNDWFTGKGDGIGRRTPLPGIRFSHE